MFTTISLLTPFAAWVNVSSMIYCKGNMDIDLQLVCDGVLSRLKLV